MPKYMTQAIRKRIGGKQYEFIGLHYTKRAAEKRAARMRKEGYSVKINAVKLRTIGKTHYEIWST